MTRRMSDGPLTDFRDNRKKRLKKVREALANMPDARDEFVHGEVDAVTLDAIESSKERDKKVKDAFKDKNKETRAFIKKQDKDTDAEERAEDRLMLDESLFKEEFEARSYYDQIEQELKDAVDNIFLRIQRQEGIKSGDISPEMSVRLDNKISVLSDLIEQILMYQE